MNKSPGQFRKKIGSFTKIVLWCVIGDKNHDIALLALNRNLPSMDSYATDTKPYPVLGEPVYAVGYPMGTFLPGQVTISTGSFGASVRIKSVL